MISHTIIDLPSDVFSMVILTFHVQEGSNATGRSLCFSPTCWPCAAMTTQQRHLLLVLLQEKPSMWILKQVLINTRRPRPQEPLQAVRPGISLSSDLYSRRRNSKTSMNPLGQGWDAGFLEERLEPTATRGSPIGARRMHAAQGLTTHIRMPRTKTVRKALPSNAKASFQLRNPALWTPASNHTIIASLFSLFYFCK